MSATRSRIAVGLLAAALLGTGGWGYGQREGRQPTRQEVRGVLKAVDGAARTVTVVAVEARKEAGDRTFPLAADVEVALGTEFGRRGAFKEGKLADLAPG